MRAEQKSLGRLRFQGAESEIVATGIWGLWGSWGGQPPPLKNSKKKPPAYDGAGGNSWGDYYAFVTITLRQRAAGSFFLFCTGQT